MSTISSVANGPSNANLLQLMQEFNSIGSALQSGNVSNAQNALSAFQQMLHQKLQTSNVQPFGQNSQANSDFLSLTADLQAGNLPAAQKAFSSLNDDLSAIAKAQTAGSQQSSLSSFVSGLMAASPLTVKADHSLSNSLNLVA